MLPEPPTRLPRMTFGSNNIFVKKLDIGEMPA